MKIIVLIELFLMIIMSNQESNFNIQCWFSDNKISSDNVSIQFQLNYILNVDFNNPYY